MKPTRYASYQPLLKALAQATIAARPVDWSEGELWVRHEGAALACSLRRGPGGEGLAPPPQVDQLAAELAQALARDGLPWVAWRIGFYRKPVGWGVRVRITPSQGAPELDLTPERGAGDPPGEPSRELREEPGAPVLPGPAAVFGLQPLTRGEWVAPLPEDPAPASAALPAMPATDTAPLRQCPHCRQHSLRFRLRDAGIDHYQCDHCGYKLSMMAPPQDFEDSSYRRKPNWAETEAPHGGEPELMPDGAIRGSGYTVRLRSPETLLYEAGNTQVPIRVVLDVARGVRVLEAARLSTVDTPFGARMLTPREHQRILQHLHQAVHLLPGRYLVE